MQILTTPQAQQRLMVSIGTYDGVHRGHRFLIEHLRQESENRGLKSGVVTFKNHPQSVVNPQHTPKTLSTLDERLALLEETGIDYCILLNFDERLRSYTAEEFMTTFLNDYGVNALILGYDNRFGRDRINCIDGYREIGKRLGVEVIQAPELKGNISSSTIRSLLLNGDVEAANEALGYEYSLTGIITAGKQLGRTIGFPTANLDVNDKNKLIPANGAYATIAITADGSKHKAMVNIGRRPTVDVKDAPITIEAHLLDFNSDIYGQSLTLKFIKFLRPEKRFNSLEELSAQLSCDLNAVSLISN
ncbi:MAG: bifunctional riboflavin kinase/FAD synthetase [Muribaculaceae bacterium]|nr:bifunctional riboflavin kinase/FAD synthetase [Muribaculaceae bacterium]